MGEDALRRVKLSCHQEGRPVNGVKAQDILAHHMHISWPETLILLGIHIRIAERGDVIGQGIEPDIHDMAFMGAITGIRHRHAPIEGGPGDRQILEAALDEAQHLIAPGGRADEIRVSLVKCQQAFLPGRQTEEIAGFLNPLTFRAGRGDLLAIRAVGQLIFLIIGLVTHGIPTGIGTEINIPFLYQLAPQGLTGLPMPFFGCADEVVIGVIQQFGEVAEVLADLIGKALRVDTCLFSRFLYLLAMFISAGQEHHVITIEPLEPGEHIAGKRGIGMADMWLVIHIIDRGRDVICRFH